MTDVTSGPPLFDVVIPTIGRPSLVRLLVALDSGVGRRPGKLIVVDDRVDASEPLVLPALRSMRPIVVAAGGGGPAAARNAGWRRGSAPWCAFLDDDVEPSTNWLASLAGDLACAPEHVAAVQGRLTVPRRGDRPPTDAERMVCNLEQATWITADMAVRRSALIEIGGFDERFRRAYREDTDLAMRLTARGWEIERGRRAVVHPVRKGNWRTSITAQRGNADDALMRRLHGRDWRSEGHAPPGDLTLHMITSAATAVAVVARRRSPPIGALSGTVAATLLARLWWRRVRQGPADPQEIARMAVSSLAIPLLATAWRAWGTLRAWRLAPGGMADRWSAQTPRLVLFDRDGTLVRDVPYNVSPDLVEPLDGVGAALERLRRRDIRVGIVTNQSGVARGLMGLDDVDAVHARLTALLGRFDVVEVCPHGPDDDCECRKPNPGMVLAAARRLGVHPHECAVVGDIGSDIEAALAAGARAVLVPTAATLRSEIEAAPEVATTFEAAVDLLLGAPAGSMS